VTREAKVGLLLGLAFIIAIAIVLRGVHEGVPAAQEEALLLGEGSSPDPPVDLQPEHLSVAVEQLAPAPGLEPTARTDSAGTSSGTPGARGGRDSSSEPLDGRVRFAQPLPGSSRISPEPGSVTVEPPDGRVDRAVSQVLPAQETGVIIPAAGAVMRERALEEVVGGVPSVRGGTSDPLGRRGPDQPVPARSWTYTVVKGDDLSKIARKMYGAVEGNRWVNIKRIYEANRAILPSMDQVRVGQKLTIPAIAGVERPGTAGSMGSARSVGQATPSRSAGRSSGAGRVYVVKEGDSLWKIAQRELGDGRRFGEIAALNADTLSDEDSLVVGMKLKLPAR